MFQNNFFDLILKNFQVGAWDPLRSHGRGSSRHCTFFLAPNSKGVKIEFKRNELLKAQAFNGTSKG